VSYEGPELLDTTHDLENFDSGNDALDIWLKIRAMSNHQSGTSRTWVVVADGGSSVVGYYASSTGSVLRELAPGAMRRNQPSEIPAVLLGRMAVDRRHQGRGIGAAMLKHLILKVGEISAIVGVRLILVHAKDEQAQQFYGHFGFTPSLVDPLTMMLRNPFE
jgi:GNAT superfamily N-acetyltransferase